jgi:nucleotide-binding universal stress UspA family protein
MGAQITLLSVLPIEVNADPVEQGTDGQATIIGREVLSDFPSLPVQLAVTRGVPQVEIPRYAERVKADLIVLGRKPRSRATRMILGDTADAVVRRTRLPAMLVPEKAPAPRRVLAALDGTDRGISVLRSGVALAQAAHLEFCAITVDPPSHGGVPLVSARSERLSARMDETLQSARSGELRKPAQALSPLRVRQGNPVQEIMAEVSEVGADILVTGFHPGGPLLVMEEGSVSRSLLHAVPCVVMTVPL